MRFIGDFDALYLFKGDKKTTIIIILIQNAFGRMDGTLFSVITESVLARWIIHSFNSLFLSM